MSTLVKALGYIVVRGPLDEWRTFGTEVLGVQPVESTTVPDTLFFRTDDRSYRIVVVDGEPGPDALQALGLEMASEENLDQLVAELGVLGHKTVENPELAQRRAVRRLVTVDDPDGNTLELYYGQTQDHSRFVSPTGVEFVAGDEMGVGHAFIGTPDPGAAAAFYREALGFRLTDTIKIGGELAYFLHCNPRHHSIALAPVPGLQGLGHLMLEVASLEDVGRALDAVKAGKAPLGLHLGEHSNDHMISFYVVTPSGFQIEYGWHGRVLDEDWTVNHYAAISNWGHQFPDGRFFPSERPF
ncbi:VOC family protein [Streptomyces sp. NPDC091215]|uniref:VOC family protein n=1 Tax=Streptomyces sp. NPDC091215 TaxID=3155192 RepID=UPI00341F64D2